MDYDAEVRRLDERADRLRKEYEKTYGPLGGARLVALSEGSRGMGDGTDHGLTAGATYGSEEAEDMIADELRTLRDRGLPAERETVELDLLNSGRIATFEEPAPVQPRERRGGGVPVLDDF